MQKIFQKVFLSSCNLTGKNHFGQEPNVSQMQDLWKNTASNINFPYKPYSEKINVQINVPIKTKFSNKFKKPYFWPIFIPYFFQDIWLSCTAPSGPLAEVQKKLINHLQQTSGQKNGRTELIYRTLLAMAGV